MSRDNVSNEKLKRLARLDEQQGMRIRSDIVAVTQTTLPRTLAKCKSYRNLVGSTGPCGSTAQLDDKIIEEEEEEEMVEGGPSNELEAEAVARPSSLPERINGTHSQPEHEDQEEEEEEEDGSERDDDEVEEANLQSPGIHRDNNDHVNNLQAEHPDIKITIDESLHQMAQEYRESFDGFAEMHRFKSFEEMHDFIKSTLDQSDSPSDTPSSKQDRYIQLLLNEKPEDRFKRLLETNQATVRQVLTRNEDILQELFSSASLDDFPSPLVSIDVNEALMSANEDDEKSDVDPREFEVEENMKRWYMIEMVGLWLKIITDVKNYREAIKKRVLKKSWGIENDRYEGIAVPLNYK